MDEADLAESECALRLAHALAVRREVVLQPGGQCHNCDEPVDAGRLFCADFNPDTGRSYCAEDWDLRERALKQRVVFFQGGNDET